MFSMLLLIALALFGFANTEVVSRGSCPTGITVQDNFDVAGYLGTWYEYGRYPAYFERNAKCNTAIYSLRTDGNVGVLNKEIDTNTGEVKDIEGYATPVDNAKLIVTFPIIHNIANSKGNYWVLATDYKSYSVVYSCERTGTHLHLTYVWILTRERLPSAEIFKAAKDVLVKNGISLEPLVRTDQTNCEALDV